MAPVAQQPSGTAGRPWSTAWSAAATSFYGRPQGAFERHFPTAVTDGPLVAEALITLAAPTLESRIRAGHPITVTDVGAGDGTLLAQLRERWPVDWRPHTRWRAIDLRARPVAIDADIDWIRGDTMKAAVPAAAGLVIAHELLDDIACDVLEVDDDATLRVVLVDEDSGHESLGPSLDDAEACRAIGVDAASVLAWCRTWWPRRRPAARVEAGRARDVAWQRLVAMGAGGLTVAMDYGHLRHERVDGVWDGGTLVGYRDGHVVRPVPDGSANITAHVAMDSCAAACPGSALVPPHDDTGARTPDGLWWLMHGTMSA